MFLNFLIFCFLAFSTWFFELSACTGISLKSKDGSVVSGRTVEFGVNLDMSVAIIPREITFVGDTPNGKGMMYRSKYAALGIYCFGDQKLMDGINEKGLVAAAFYFPGYAKYAQITLKNQMNAISPIEFPNWVLTQFATIDEVKSAISSVVIAPTILKSWGPTPAPMHYIVYDKEGRSIVIEPLNGTLVVYENPIGVITNSPTFDWHLTNLNNYINLTPMNVGPISLKGLKLTSFGQGSGMGGLPGDFTPPSRFVRAAFFSSTAVPSDNANESVNQAFHILNQFDIPYGSVQGKENGQTEYDSTLLTSVKDAQNLTYYFKTYDDQIIKSVVLKPSDFNGKAIKVMKIKGNEKSVDVSSLLH